MYKFTVFLKSGEAVMAVADKCESIEGELVFLQNVISMKDAYDMVALFAAGAWSHVMAEKVAK